MVFVICMGSMYRYFVEYGSCIQILCEIRILLKLYEKYVWIFCEKCVCKIYGSMRDIEVKYSKYISL